MATTQEEFIARSRTGRSSGRSAAPRGRAHPPRVGPRAGAAGVDQKP
jgi:hypothetical protein